MKQVLFPSQKKKRTASPDFDHVLDFTKDKIDALLLLLQIAHLQFANIPKRLPYETLHGVAVLCGQYDCRKLAKPWLADWLKEDWNESNANIGDGGECMIDGGFYYPRPYCRESTPVESYPLEKDGILLPLDTVESILDTRQKAIEQILAAVYGVVEKYEGKKKYDRIQHEPGCSFECDATNLGFLVKGLQEEDLWPRPSPGDIRMNIHDLVKILYRIDRVTSRKGPPKSTCERPA
ncbi:hypothetical protein BDZ45DRAFT_730369 [Acephala macrosclerotiorum]|nr:hypothetical protein BDZ45DRAFT_730369 [Acephala macrosclerotiorum]